MQKIALVGFGWLGLPLGKHLKESGFDVVGTTTSESKLLELEKLGFKTILLNLNAIGDEKELIQFFSDCEICVLTIPPSKSLFQTYQNQCLKLVSFFSENTKFIFTSSTSVYTDKVQLASEDTQILSDYNFTSQLFQTEKTLSKLLGNRLTILRLAGLFGENRNPAKFLSGKSNLQNAKGLVNLVHQEDVIRFITEIIKKDIWGNCFNVCSSEHPTREEFYTWMCAKENLAEPQFEKSESSPDSKIVSNDKGKTKLNFTYKFDSPFEF